MMMVRHSFHATICCSHLPSAPGQFVARTNRGINKVILLGNAGAEAKTRTYNDGMSTVAFFPLATNQLYTNKSGERVSKPQWHNIVIYNENLAGVAQKTVKKGCGGPDCLVRA